MFQLPASLDLWIRFKLHVYSCKKKPRKGTPRGKPYPIPEGKYHAALLHLAYNRNFNLQAIAKRAKVSYSLLLKWRTEDRFVDLIRQAIREYSDMLVSYIIRGDHPEYDAASYYLFMKDELLRYSLPLAHYILEKVSREVKIYDKKFLSPKELDERDWQHVEQIYMFLTTLKRITIDTWGSKPEKIRYQQEMTNMQSQALKGIRQLFKLALKKGWQKQLQETFDVVWGLAEEANKEVLYLKKELIERGLDTVIMEATNKKSREG